jgi:hypothetical protein
MNRVNAGYQMVPFFLCANSNPRKNLLCDGRPCKVLNIVIDIFGDEEQLEASKKYAIDSLSDKRELDAPLDTSNITQFFINISDVRNGILQDAMKQGKNPYIAEEHHLFLGMLADTICKKVRENGITDKNYMVVNYIKFKHPNPIEQNIGMKASNTLEKVMTDNGYEQNYYEWYGYRRMVFYNCIILKKDMNFIETAFNRYFNIFKEKLSNEDLKIFDLVKSDFITKKYDFTEKKYVFTEKLTDLLKKFYPIQIPNYMMFNYSDEEKINNFCYSVYNLLF